MDGETQGGGYGQLASLALPIAAGAASFIRPQAAYPLISLAQMAETAGYRDALLKEKADQQAREDNERSSMAALLKANFGVDVDPSMSPTSQAQVANLYSARAKAEREEADKRAQRAIGGGLAQVSADLPNALPDETLQGLNALLAKSGGMMTESQEARARDIRTDAEKLRGGLANARAFEAPFRVEQTATFGELPPAPEPPGTFSLTTNEGTDPLLASLKEFLPTGLPEPPAPLRYSTVDPKAMPFSESITRGAKAPTAEEMFAAGLPGEKIPGGDKILAERKKAGLDLEKSQIEIDAARRKAAGIPEGPTTDVGKLYQDKQWLLSTRGLAPDAPEVQAIDRQIKQAETGAAQSPLGKLQEDAARAARVYGANSPQVRAFASAIQNEMAGPNAVKPSDYEAIRGQFNTRSVNFITQATNYANVASAKNDPSAAGDLQLIFAYMKLLDPTSVVREGEFANAQNTQGVPDMVRNFYNRAMKGERMNPPQRADFLKSAESVFSNALRQQKQLEDQYGGIAQRQGMDPRNVVVDYIGPYRELLNAPPAAPGEPPKSLTPPKPGRTLRFDAKGNLIP